MAWFGVSFIAFLAFFFIDHSPWSDELTTYPVVCADANRRPPECLLTPIDRVVYKLNPPSRSAVYYFGDSLSNAILWPLHDCRIFDRTNWTCTLAGSHREKLRVRDGIQSTTGREIYVRRWQWYLLKLLGPTQLGFLPEQQRPNPFD